MTGKRGYKVTLTDASPRGLSERGIPDDHPPEPEAEIAVNTMPFQQRP
jgi:hypothetical protein